MPIQREHIQLAFLLLCVPIQYLVVHYSGSSEDTRSYHISLIVKQVKQFYNHWLTLQSWLKWCKNTLALNPDPGKGESLAVEVLKHNEAKQKGAFASSAQPRAFRYTN